MRYALIFLAACLSKPSPPSERGDGGVPNDGAMIDTPPPSGGFTKLSVGDDHACAIDGMQRLYCWGRADFGQLGNITTATPSPTLMTTETGWTEISAGGLHSCGILNGRVRCWGSNSVGQTTGTTIFDDIILTGFTPTALFVHDAGSCALDATGAVMCWGQPAAPVGDPTRMQIGTTSPQIQQIAANDDHACALATDGQAYCWGANAFQQLGTNATGVVLPVDAVAISGKHYKALAIGGQNTCGIRASDSAIECWGDLTAPMVPNGNPIVDATRTWTAISMGNDAMCGIAGGGLRCWGYGEFGQTALGITSVQAISATPALTGVSHVGMGDDYGCALAGNTVSCWGQNRYGNVGNGQIARALQPVEVFGTGDAQYIAVGSDHACFALEGPGDTYCWGDNRNHQVDPSTGTKFITTPTAIGHKLKLLSAGRAHTCGIVIANNHALCWGNNDDGELGGGSAAQDIFESTLAFISISAGTNGTCGVSDDHKVYCWGQVNGANLGPTPVQQTLPMHTYTQVALGDSHTIATDNTKVYGWGSRCAAIGTDGGDVPASSAQPLDIPGSPTNIDIAVGLDGGSDSCALTNTGLFCWGKNEQLELSPTQSGCMLPFQRTSGVADISHPDPNHPGGKLAMANDHGCAMSTDGNATCWGDNYEREIGTRGELDHPDALLSPFNSISFGSFAVGNTIGCGVLSTNGHVVCWGTSPYGELGNGTMFVGTPTPVVP